MNVEWTEVPPGRTKLPDGFVDEFVATLRTRPGHWAKYPKTLASPSNVTIYRKKYPGTEWASRKREDGRCDIYARWAGDE